ncbi:hypothetical protein NE857_14175 [Nocardiopsis exhalans]|uniref:HEAT repeat domain-containing protein n=1 Tax=Nocardiopsis exhalans TaxID=163604 RepID=A0ABY5DE80_9ACTN|nr:hypothetical protein [Nocardiopsis exhalans]USY22649.1 hypothetical protein NE857_14175 [Nocardiopsis exhalans]
MDTAPDILRTTDWSRTFHAYGPGTDAPKHLAALRSGQDSKVADALGYLYSAILHQGTVYPATPPAVLHVAGLLSDPAADRPVHGVFDEAMGAGAAPLRQHLLRFLADVAWSVAEVCGGYSDAELDALADPGERRGELDAFLERMARSEDGDADDGEEVWEDPLLETVMNTVLRDLRRAAPVLLEAVRPLLTHRDRGVRQRAVTAAGALSRMGGGLALDLSGAADYAESRDEGAAIVLALAESGGDTAEFLTHQDPAIRACAALAPSLTDDPAATTELRTALLDPAAADAWFADRPGYFDGHVRFSMVKALVERSESEDAPDLLPVFQALAAVSSAFTAERDLQGLLSLALGRERRSAAAPVEYPTELQRAYLRALVDSDGLWDPGTADFTFLLKGLGLPPVRESMRSLAESS